MPPAFGQKRVRDGHGARSGRPRLGDEPTLALARKAEPSAAVSAVSYPDQPRRARIATVMKRRIIAAGPSRRCVGRAEMWCGVRASRHAKKLARPRKFIGGGPIPVFAAVGSYVCCLRQPPYVAVHRPPPSKNGIIRRFRPATKNRRPNPPASRHSQDRRALDAERGVQGPVELPPRPGVPNFTPVRNVPLHVTTL